MTTFALIHGAGDGGWAWHLVRRGLRERGHDAVAPDLPTDRDEATWADCVDVVAAAVADADAGDVVLVGHSAGGLVVPLAAARLGASLQVYVAGLVPRAGETPGAWFDNVGWSEAIAEQEGGLDADPMAAFYHDVPADLAAQAMARERATAARLGETPYPSVAPPTAAARYVVTTRDRFLPPAVQRRVAAERLGIDDPEEVEAGHCANLSRPDELAALLVGYVDPARSPGDRGPARG